MAKRAAICIGVNRAGSMPPLQAAVKGAREFEDWARARGCETTLLVDDGKPVRLADVFDAVNAHVQMRNCEQLIVFFSGHGCLGAPGCEYWLLSSAPENSNEAVNLFRSIEDARMAGLPHVVFVSDACRSRSGSPPLSAVSGGTIFPYAGDANTPGEVDVFYATRPGDPAWELPMNDAAQGYSGVFTDALLAAVESPTETLIDKIAGDGVPIPVITSRKLKEYLEATVSLQAAERDIRIRQVPQVRVETALPKYFGTVDPASVRYTRGAVPKPFSMTLPTFGTALRALSNQHFETSGNTPPPRDIGLAQDLGLTAELERLSSLHGRRHFETHTGVTVHGAEPLEIVAAGWRADAPFVDPDNATAWHIRLTQNGPGTPADSLIIAFRSAAGTTHGALVAVLDEFIANVVLDDGGRVVSVSYVPSENSSLWSAYAASAERIAQMRAYAALASRNGSFFVENESTAAFAERIRIDKACDPTLGIYATYAYAQEGARKDVVSVFDYMAEDTLRPVPFDVAMLAARYGSPDATAQRIRFAPFAPMLAQGWALLAERDPLFLPIHAELRSHLVPSLWTTFDAEGLRIATRYLNSGGV